MAETNEECTVGENDRSRDEGIDASVRVFLWMIPRTCSTVLTKCMSFVDDCVVWMEPYNMCFLNETEFNPEFMKHDPDMIKHRALVEQVSQSHEFQKFFAAVLQKAAALPNMKDQSLFTYPWLQEQLSNDEANTKVIFVKDETFAIVGKEKYLPKVSFRHTFLIRHPREVFVSYRRLVADTGTFGLMKVEDCDLVKDNPSLPVTEFYKKQLQMLEYVTKNIEPNPIIIDAYDFLSNPKGILSKYFDMLGIPFKDSYLKWDGSMESVVQKFRGSQIGVMVPSEQTTLKKAFTSSCFDPPKYPRGVVAEQVNVTQQMEKLIEEAMPYYEEMYSKRLVVED